MVDDAVAAVIENSGGLVVVRRNGSVVALREFPGILREEGYPSGLELTKQMRNYAYQARVVALFLESAEPRFSESFGCGQFIDEKSVHRLEIGKGGTFACGTIVPKGFEII